MSQPAEAGPNQRSLQRHCQKSGSDYEATLNAIKRNFVPEIVNPTAPGSELEDAISLFLSMTPEANDQPAMTRAERKELDRQYAAAQPAMDYPGVQSTIRSAIAYAEAAAAQLQVAIKTAEIVMTKEDAGKDTVLFDPLKLASGIIAAGARDLRGLLQAFNIEPKQEGK